jgi:hypothetical protein
MEPLAVGDERTRFKTEMSESLQWLSKQLPELTKRFSPYIQSDERERPVCTIDAHCLNCGWRIDWKLISGKRFPN